MIRNWGILFWIGYTVQAKGVIQVVMLRFKGLKDCLLERVGKGYSGLFEKLWCMSGVQVWYSSISWITATFTDPRRSLDRYFYGFHRWITCLVRQVCDLGRSWSLEQSSSLRGAFSSVYSSLVCGLSVLGSGLQTTWLCSFDCQWQRHGISQWILAGVVRVTRMYIEPIYGISSPKWWSDKSC